MVLEVILLATLVVSAISLIGAFTLAVKDKLLHQLLPLFVAFAGGSMLATAFFHALPEALKDSGPDAVMPLVVAGILIFFFIERFLHWHHHHKHHHEADAKEERVPTYLVLIGDSIHNFVDGTVIAASFLASFPLGVLATISIIAHEIPQEIGDFSLLIWGGFSKQKALAFNFLSALTALAGAILTYFLAPAVPGLVAVLLPLAAGNFIYVACVDLVPELHKERDTRRSLMQLACFVGGILLVVVVGALMEPHGG
ncbi:Zinc transporter ZupT [uncultured archaeon]|nr:Zinc transporter ZupT [uncultured archaeon]